MKNVLLNVEDLAENLQTQHGKSFIDVSTIIITN